MELLWAKINLVLQYLFAESQLDRYIIKYTVFFNYYS